jgi:hypothetical protein
VAAARLGSRRHRSHRPGCTIPFPRVAKQRAVAVVPTKEQNTLAQRLIDHRMPRTGTRYHGRVLLQPLRSIVGPRVAHGLQALHGRIELAAKQHDLLPRRVVDQFVVATDWRGIGEVAQRPRAAVPFPGLPTAEQDRNGSQWVEGHGPTSRRGRPQGWRTCPCLAIPLPGQRHRRTASPSAHRDDAVAHRVVASTGTQSIPWRPRHRLLRQPGRPTPSPDGAVVEGQRATIAGIGHGHDLRPPGLERQRIGTQRPRAAIPFPRVPMRCARGEGIAPAENRTLSLLIIEQGVIDERRRRHGPS